MESPLTPQGEKNAPAKRPCTQLAPKEPKGRADGLGALRLRCSFGFKTKHLLPCHGISKVGMLLVLIRWSDVHFP
jgi:hypothetical protein